MGFFLEKFLNYVSVENDKQQWEVLMWFDSEAAAWVSGAAETVDYFG